ncbi:heme oxygenase [Renibacterium salmoninarum ATCC 33209]|uniref:Heme oxygenase n=1 Tax=Renibacterium salmoninarum (strain ATCC 33209 / DSM 20767 / JCM 11484 / NBRC 15589 / NCIMB 2235) TaxID=288705 RepID=A9WRJ1_RENSM|nr:biliverdin-producing heme oxygenase [Renibacterium salmoninarum]ABY24273.1 heme oxygenase [Renibacterium salmoninarum ATCC 33209]
MTSNTDFSHALRESTHVMHQNAHDSPFIAELMTGKRTIADYTALATQQYFFYLALEETAAKLQSNEIAGGFHCTELSRVPEIEKDLAFLIGPHWRDVISPLPVTRRYTEQIAQTEAWPAGFVAHHYTRYLGDLSGDQIMQRLLQRQFGLDVDGVHFYAFPAIPKTKPFKDQYRAKLNTLSFNAAEQKQFIDEVTTAFSLNIAVFTDLAKTTATAA